jgi:hypothetical protein
MNAIVSKPAIGGLLFLLTALSGIWLSHSGKPYNSGIFTIHKLVALGTVIFLAVNAYRLYKVVDLQVFIGLAVIAAAGLFFLALIVSGSLLSVNVPLGGAALRIHQIAPLLALLASVVTFYVLASART